MTPGEAALGTLALATLIVGGLSVLSLIPQTPWCSTWPVRLALAHLVGAALMAWTVTVAALARGRLTILPVYVVFGILAVWAWATRPNPNPKGMGAHRRGIWISFLILAVALGILSTGSALITDPNMGIDAHAIWAKKAKAFYLASSFGPLMKGCCNKPNYPVLFPLQSWWVYKHIQHVDDWWHEAMGFIFYLDGVVIAFAGCRAFMPVTWAWMATSIVANNLLNVLLATRGFADSALAAYFLASALFLNSYISRRKESSRIPVLLLSLGALQTKNEGLTWAVFAGALLLVFEVRWGYYKRAASTFAWFFLAIAPWQVFKLRHSMVYGPEEPLATLETLKLEWALRLKTILLAHFADFGPVSLSFLLLLCLPLMWRRWERISKPVLALIGAQFAAYLVIYLVVQNPEYQLYGFVARGLGHLSPALICTCLIGYHWRTKTAP